MMMQIDGVVILRIIVLVYQIRSASDFFRSRHLITIIQPPDQAR